MHDPAIPLATSEDLPRLMAVWESAVRATHDFLHPSDLDRLRPLVRAGLAAFAPLHVLRDGGGVPYAFLGVEHGAIEMLFVHDAWRGRGAGRRLVHFAIEALGAKRVDVNEQNTLGVGFYRHLGFRAVARSPLDGQGQPYPILHLLLDRRAAGPRLAKFA